MKPAKPFIQSHVKLRDPQVYADTANVRVKDPLAVGIEELKRHPFVAARSRSPFTKSGKKRKHKK